MFTVDWDKPHPEGKKGKRSNGSYIYVGSKNRPMIMIPKELNEEGEYVKIELDEEKKQLKIIFNPENVTKGSRKLTSSGGYFWTFGCASLIQWIHENVKYTKDVLDYKWMHYKFPYVVEGDIVIVNMEDEK